MKLLLILLILISTPTLAEKTRYRDYGDSSAGVLMHKYGTAMFSRVQVADGHSVMGAYGAVDDGAYYQYDTAMVGYEWAGEHSAVTALHTKQDNGVTYSRVGGSHTFDVAGVSVTPVARVGFLKTDYGTTNEYHVGLTAMKDVGYGYVAGFVYGGKITGSVWSSEDTMHRAGGTMGVYLGPTVTASYTVSADSIYGSEGTSQVVTLDWTIQQWVVSGYYYQTTQDYVDPSFGVALSYKW